MKKLIAVVFAAIFATATLVPVAVAADKAAAKKPTVEECKKDMKIKGCDEVMKQKK